MSTVTTCPNVQSLQRLVSGQLHEPEIEPVVRHLEGCDACVRKLQLLPASDTLSDLLANARTIPPGTEEAVVNRLIARLQRIGKPAAPPPPATLTFACPGCGKSLKTKPDLAGKKVKCPSCGQAVAVPGAATNCSQGHVAGAGR
jgi:hypothetical protein